jgi:hypothetical protein
MGVDPGVSRQLIFSEPGGFFSDRGVAPGKHQIPVHNSSQIL